MEPPPEPPPPARANASTSAEAKAAWSGFMKQRRTAQAVKKISKPRGLVPSDEFGLKQWSDIKGEWQSSGPAHDAPAADSNDSGTDNDDGGASASVDGASRSTAKRRRTQAPRKFQATWKGLLPALFCISVLAAGAKCAVREDCPGCPACAAMFCEDCQLRGEKNNFATRGCTDFHKKAIRMHKSVWHPDRIGSDIAKGLAKTISAQQELIKGTMKNVYWLGKENCALAKTKSLGQLVVLHGVPLTQHYWIL